MYGFLIDENSEIALRALIRELDQVGNNLAAFVGAGVSRQAGLPLWKELMAAMDKEAQKYSERTPLVRRAVLRTSDVLWQAEFFRKELERRAGYERFLRRTFERDLEAGKEVLGCLVRLPFRHFMTTNYDTFLQQALRNEGLKFNEFDWTNRQECRDFFLTYLLADTKRSVIHIHGRVDQPGTVILSHRDYVARYVASSEYVEKLSVLFATLRLVFIGFSLDDPDLKFILRQVNNHFGTGDVQNYAILGFPRDMEGQAEVERERLERQFGIQSVFYDDANGHAALGKVLQAMGTSADPPNSLDQPEELVKSRGDIWNTDPNKGRFGGLSERDGRRLRVHDHQDEGDGIHAFHLSVESVAEATPLAGTVMFHLHPTFARPVVAVPVQNGKATLSIRAYGAFTVGAECETPRVRLELDLATADQVLPGGISVALSRIALANRQWNKLTRSPAPVPSPSYLG